MYITSVVRVVCVCVFVLFGQHREPRFWLDCWWVIMKNSTTPTTTTIDQPNPPITKSVGPIVSFDVLRSWSKNSGYVLSKNFVFMLTITLRFRSKVVLADPRLCLRFRNCSQFFAELGPPSGVGVYCGGSNKVMCGEFFGTQRVTHPSFFSNTSQISNLVLRLL